jgi:hypothetical protein
MGRPYSNRAPTMTTSLGFNDDNNSEEHTITSSIYNVDTGSMQKIMSKLLAHGLSGSGIVRTFPRNLV